jgi:hypothetical protein
MHAHFQKLSGSDTPITPATGTAIEGLVLEIGKGMNKRGERRIGKGEGEIGKSGEREMSSRPSEHFFDEALFPSPPFPSLCGTLRPETNYRGCGGGMNSQSMWHSD